MCVSEREQREQVCVCVFVCGGFRAGKAPSRCLLWSSDEELAGGEVEMCVSNATPLFVPSLKTHTCSVSLQTNARALSLGGTLSFHKLQ